MWWRNLGKRVVVCLVLSGLFSGLDCFAQNSGGAGSPSAPAAQTPAKKSAGGITIELQSDKEQTDFEPYLKGIYVAVRKSWVTEMPASVVEGKQGVCVVEFRVTKDGKVPERSLGVSSGSGRKDLDEASLQAVHKAAPFEGLPAGYAEPSIDVRMTFYYNTDVPKK
jgi:TonB family protein